jgi:hypothetical protein
MEVNKMEIKKEIYILNEKKWSLGHETTGPDAARDLAQILNAKYLEKAPYIKSIRRVQHYTHKTITAILDTGVKLVFTVPAHF